MNIMELMEQHKKDVERKLVDAIITALEQGNLRSEEVPAVSDFILQKIELLKTHHDLVGFLDELSTQWPVFSQVDILEHAEEQEETERLATANVQDLINHGDLDAAIAAAKTVTNEQVTFPQTQQTAAVPTQINELLDQLPTIEAKIKADEAAAQEQTASQETTGQNTQTSPPAQVSENAPNNQQATMNVNTGGNPATESQ